jgi:putative transposase
MPWKPSTLSRRQREERRLHAGKLLKAGKLSQAEIAREVGVSRAAVCQWAKHLKRNRNRLPALKAKAVTGRPPRLPHEQWQRLLRLLGKGALAFGFDTDRWTLPRIRDVIRREFGVEYHPRSLGRKLRALGWSQQVPAPRARERDDELVEAWLKQDWPRIKKRLAGSRRRSSSSTRPDSAS